MIFGQEGAPPARVGEAVSASCAIPAYFAPVEIDGVRYVDGGAHSLSHLLEVAGEGLDLVIVIAPMSRTGHRSFTGLLAGWSAGNVFVREAVAGPAWVWRPSSSGAGAPRWSPSSRRPRTRRPWASI